MYKPGDKLICKSSVFLSADFWLLKGRTYTIRDIDIYPGKWVKFLEHRQNVKLHTDNLEKYFYSTTEMRKFKLQEIENNTQSGITNQ